MQFDVAQTQFVISMHAHASGRSPCLCGIQRLFCDAGVNSYCCRNVVDHVHRRCQSCLHAASYASQTPLLVLDAKFADHVPQQPQFSIQGFHAVVCRPQ